MGTCQTKLDLGDFQLEASSDPAKDLLNLQLHYNAYDGKSREKIDKLTKKFLDVNIANASKKE